MTQTEQQQTEKIEAGLAAAEHGEFVTDAEMEQIFNLYQPEGLRCLWNEGLNSGPSRFADIAEIKAEAHCRLNARRGKPE